jgi:hypothetical protein
MSSGLLQIQILMNAVLHFGFVVLHPLEWEKAREKAMTIAGLVFYWRRLFATSAASAEAADVVCNGGCFASQVS